MKSRTRNNQLLAVRTSERWLEDVRGVKEAVVSHFSEVFAELEVINLHLDGIQFKQIIESDMESISVPFSPEEIKETVWSCEGGNPRPDEFNMEFFKGCEQRRDKE